MRALALVVCAGCATTSGDLLSLMDAETDGDKEAATLKCAAALERGRPAVRLAAAKTLGRLQVARPEAIDALGATLTSNRNEPELRTMAAWALGEMRSPNSLPPLVSALRTPLDPTTGHHILEALAKHYAVMSGEESRLVEIVEAMVYFSGNQNAPVSGMYDVLGGRLRTISVNIRVLERALDGIAERRTPEQMAEVYTAAFELLARIELTKEEIAAGPDVWKTRVDESIRQVQRTYASTDPQTALMVLWYLGRLSALREIGQPASRALLGDGSSKTRPTAARDPAVRLVAVWALTRMLLYGTSAKRALMRDILPKELHPAVLDVLGGPEASGQLDPLQKISGGAP